MAAPTQDQAPLPRRHDDGGENGEKGQYRPARIEARHALKESPQVETPHDKTGESDGDADADEQRAAFGGILLWRAHPATSLFVSVQAMQVRRSRKRLRINGPTVQPRTKMAAVIEKIQNSTCTDPVRFCPR